MKKVLFTLFCVSVIVGLAIPGVVLGAVPPQLALADVAWSEHTIDGDFNDGGQAVGAVGAWPPPPELRVATVNLLHGFHSEEDASTLVDRLALVAEALRHEEVDVVGVQEASITSYGGNVAQELAHQLGFRFVYQRANPNVEGLTEEENDALARLIGFEEGSAILSRFPIIDREDIELPRPFPYEGRIALRATLATIWGHIDVYVTHFTADREETDNRLAQAQAMVEWITSNPRELPAFLMGDFNDLEGSPPIDLLTAEFVDTYRVIDPTGPGYTSRNDRRIDYLFLVPGQAFAGEVVDAYVFLDSPFLMPDGSYLWASDHFGVLAEITFPADDGGGCFIATAAYGSYLDSHVETLRQFRDDYLLTNPVGQALVSTYYKVSPPVAEFIDEHPALKPVVRAALLPAVAISEVAIGTTMAQKTAIMGSLALVSIVLTVWLSRRRGKGVIS
jgi:endonuclease/exonuclease/phosphatase family metal-dependent hydrolase